MSGFFKYIEHCPNVAGSLPDGVTEGDSDYGLELEALFISDCSTEIVTASIEIVTVPSSDEEPEILEADIPALTAAEIRERVERMMRGMDWMRERQRRGGPSRGMTELLM